MNEAQTSARVLRALGRFDVADTDDLVEALGLERARRMALWKMLSRLVAAGVVGRRQRGEYFVRRA